MKTYMYLFTYSFKPVYICIYGDTARRVPLGRAYPTQCIYQSGSESQPPHKTVNLMF